MMLLFKARKMPVGTIRRRKAGRFVKDKPGHWKMLHEIVNDKLGAHQVHPNTDEGKAMHAAARKLTSHMVGRKEILFNRTVADKFLNDHFGHLKYRRFGAWKTATIESVKKYLKHLEMLYANQTPAGHTEAFDKVRSWQNDLKRGTQGLLTDAERDAWVSERFAARGKPVAHILFVCRGILGDTHLSMVQEGSFKGFLRAIIEKVYEHGPAGIEKSTLKQWEKAFKTMFDRADTQRLVPLAKALAQGNSQAIFRKHPKWFEYCCRRYAAKNDGVVDMAHIPKYMENSMKYHKSKNPPSVDYDDATGGMRSRVREGVFKPKDEMKRLYMSLKRRK